MTRTYLLAVAAAGSVLLLSGCSPDRTQDEAAPATSAPSSTATPPTVSAPTPSAPATVTPEAPAGELIDFEDSDDNGTTLTSSGDVTKLTGAPDDFKAFIAKELAKDRATSDDACTEKPQIYVTKLDTGGWASGGHFVPQCGGYATLWAKPGGVWKEVWSGQELTDCKTLKKYRFPADVVGGTCLDGSGEVPYTAGGVDAE